MRINRIMNNDRTPKQKQNESKKRPSKLNDMITRRILSYSEYLEELVEGKCD